MSKSKNILIVSAISVLGAVGIYLYAQYNYIKKICFGVKGFKIKNASPSNVSIGLDLEIKNLGNLDIAISKIRMSAFANNRFVADIDSSDLVNIKPKSSSFTNINIALNPKQFLSDSANILSSMNYKNIKLSFKGYVVVKKIGLSIRVPVDLSSSISELISEDSESSC